MELIHNILIFLIEADDLWLLISFGAWTHIFILNLIIILLSIMLKSLRSKLFLYHICKILIKHASKTLLISHQCLLLDLCLYFWLVILCLTILLLKITTPCGFLFSRKLFKDLITDIGGVNDCVILGLLRICLPLNNLFINYHLD